MTKQAYTLTPTVPVCSFRYARNGYAKINPAQYAIRHIPCKFLNSGIRAYIINVARRNGTDNKSPETMKRMFNKLSYLKHLLPIK